MILLWIRLRSCPLQVHQIGPSNPAKVDSELMAGHQGMQLHSTQYPQTLPLAIVGRIFMCTVVAILTSCTWAQMPDPVVTRPAGAGRVVAKFDFEERTTNPEDVPRNWFRSQQSSGGTFKDGFPDWNLARLSYVPEGGTAFAGEGSLELPIRGGSAAIKLSPGVIPVFEDADYGLWVRYKSHNLKHARAFMVARFLSRDGKPLVNAVFTSAPLISEESWSTAWIDVPGGVEGSAFLQLELLVLQPRMFMESILGSHKIWPEDYQASVWFDDLIITQPPRVELWTNHSSNIIAANEKPVIHASIRDMTGEAIEARLRIFDSEGREVDHTDLNVETGLVKQTWQPKLTKYGWYRCSLDILNEDSRVGGGYIDIAYLMPGLHTPDANKLAQSNRAHDTRRSIDLITGKSAAATHLSNSRRSGNTDNARFGIVVDDGSSKSIELLPYVMSRLDAESIRIPALTESLTPSNVESHTRTLAKSLDALLSSHRRVSLSIGPVPDAAAENSRLGPEDGWSFMLQDTTSWMPYLGTLMDKYGQRITHWQLGRWIDAAGPSTRNKFNTDLDSIRSGMSMLVAGPQLLVPVESQAVFSYEPPASGAAMVAVMSPNDASSVLDPMLSSAHDAGLCKGALDSILIPRMDPNLYGRRAPASEIVKRLVHYWSGIHGSSSIATQAPRFDIQQPWVVANTRRSQLMPQSELPAWHAAISHLRGRRMAGQFPVSPGVVCWILAPNAAIPGEYGSRSGGALVLWNSHASPHNAVLEAYLGPGQITIHDIFGNAVAAEQSVTESGQPVIRVQAGNEPVFIEGIDIEFTRFLAGIRVEPQLLENNNSKHELELAMENPWPTGISGNVRIITPGGFDTASKDRSWRVSPRSFQISVPPGNTGRFPFGVSFSPAEEVGLKDFVLEVQVTSDHQYRPVQVTRTMEVGLADLSMDLSYSLRGNSNDDLVIEVAISNTGRRSRTLQLTAFAPDQPRLKASVSDLVAGTQTIRRFTYPGALKAIKGQRVIISAADTASEARLTKSLVIQ